MSLINEALKKAQRQRLEEQAAAAATAPDASAAPAPAAAQVIRRSPPRRSNNLVLVGAGAVVLVVVSVVATVFLLNRNPASSTPAAVAGTPILTPSNPAVTVAPDVKAPVISAAPVAVSTAEIALPATNAQSSASGSTVAAVSTPVEPAAEVTPATPPPPALTIKPQSAPAETVSTAAAKPDERIIAFVDSVRVAGIRSSGNESRVLMNDRVYRVNDIVERILLVRLTKVAADSLTFTDANGVTYVKNF